MKNHNIQKQTFNKIKFFLLTVFFILALTVIYLLTAQISKNNFKKNVFIKYNAEINTSINTLSNSISLIQTCNKINFELLKKEKKNINSAVASLKNMSKQVIFFNNSTTVNIINNMEFLWKDIIFDINSLIDNEEETTDLYEVLSQINLLAMQTKTYCKQFFEEMLILNITTNKISLAQQTIWIADRLSTNINNYINGVQSTEISADMLQKDISSLLKLTNTFKNGNAATNTTKIEDKKVIAYLSQIDINLHQTSVLVKSIDRSFATVEHIKSMANSIQQSFLTFNENCIKLIDASVNDHSNKNIFQYIYGLIFILMIFTILVVIYLFRGKFFQNNNNIVIKNNENMILAKLATDIEKLAKGDFEIKLTPNQEYEHLINAINKYTAFIVSYMQQDNQLIEKIAVNIDKIIKDNIDINKYNSLKNNCLVSIKKSFTTTGKIIEQYDVREKSIITNIENNNEKIKKLIPLTAKLNDMLNINNSKSVNKNENDLLIDANDYLELLADIQNNIEIFKINSEIKLYQQDDSNNIKHLESINEINNKVIKLKNKLSSHLQNNNKISNTNLAADKANNTEVCRDIITEINTIITTSQKLSKYSLSYLTSGIDKNNTELEKATIDNLKLLDKAFTKLLSNQQIEYKTINKIKEFIEDK